MEDASLPLQNNQACYDAIYQAKTSLPDASLTLIYNSLFDRIKLVS